MISVKLIIFYSYLSLHAGFFVSRHAFIERGQFCNNKPKKTLALSLHEDIVVIAAGRRSTPRVASRRIPTRRERDWAPLSSERRLWNGREAYAVVCEANAIWLHELPFFSLSRPERAVAQSRRQTHVPFADASIYSRASFFRLSRRELTRREGYTQFSTMRPRS